MQFRCYFQQAEASSPDQLIKLAGLCGREVVSAEGFEREWDKIWPDTDSADLAVRAAGR